MGIYHPYYNAKGGCSFSFETLRTSEHGLFFSRFTLPLLKGLWYRRVMALLDIQKNYMRIELDLASRDFCLAQMQGAPCPLLLSAV